MTDYNSTDVEITTKLMDETHRNALIAEAVADGRKLVTIREITSINDIPGADLIKVAQVDGDGWQVVVKAGEFKVGDLCVFFEVDCFLPLSDPRFEFLRKSAITWQGIEGVRLRTIRLRKQLSQGLALPLTMFPELIPLVKEFAPLTVATIADLRQINVTGLVGVMKWDKPISAQLAGQTKGNFPSFLRKSDQERCQNMGQRIFGYDDEYIPVDVSTLSKEAFAAMKEKGELVVHAWDPASQAQVCRIRKAQADPDELYEVSIKFDGSSMTIYHRNGDVGVCSRNLELKIEGNEENSFVNMANNYFETLKLLGKNIALQGELMGPGIQGNRENFSYNRFFVYNVFDINTGEFLLPKERWKIIDELNDLAEASGMPLFEHVTILHREVKLSDLGITNMAQLLEFAEGPSIVNPVREGLVFKSHNSDKQFKSISNTYLEQEK